MRSTRGMSEWGVQGLCAGQGAVLLGRLRGGGAVSPNLVSMGTRWVRHNLEQLRHLHLCVPCIESMHASISCKDLY